MNYLILFLTFFKIGLVSFGGGYAMISMIRQECLAMGWLTEEELLNFIAISESTPGPIAVNMATFIGSSQGNILGAACATLGVVLPAFLIMLIIAIFIKNLLKYGPVKAIFNTIKPIVVSLIISTALMMFLNLILGIDSFKSTLDIDYKGLIIFAIIALISFGYKKITKKAFSPILLILISGVIGFLFYGL